MRQCVFVIGTRAQLMEVAPLLRLARQSRLRHSVWFTTEQQGPTDALMQDLELSSSAVIAESSAPRSDFRKVLFWIPATLYRCFHYVRGVKIWTTKSPLVVVHGDTLSTWLGTIAGRWGGAQIVHLQGRRNAGSSKEPFMGRLRRRSVYGKARFAFCSDADAANRMRRYPACTVVDVGEDSARASQMTIDTLLRWSGGKSSDD